MCRHVQTHPGIGTLCVPLFGDGETLGLLHLEFAVQHKGATSGQELRHMQSRQRLSRTVADHLAMALANLMLRDRLAELSVRDPLTGLFNRRFMEETLAREIKNANRKNETVGIVMIDVDHFKDFNDNFGHEAGDRALKGLAAFLLGSVRGSDVACRYGGEEFILIMPGANLEITYQRAEHLRLNVEKNLRIEYHDRDLEITISAGVAVYPLNGDTSSKSINAADEALYMAKNTGRNRVVTARPDVADSDLHE